MDLAGATDKQSSTPAGGSTSPARTLVGGVLVVAGIAVLIGTGFSSPADAGETALLIGGASSVAAGVLLLLWQAKQRPIALIGINAAPSLLFWWTALILGGNLDSTSPGWLRTALSIFEVFGIPWALIGAVFVGVYAVQRANSPSPATGSGSASNTASMTRYERLMLLATASGGVATIVAAFLTALLK